MVIKERYKAVKARAEEINNDNEDPYKKISDVMNKVSKSERLQFEAEENTKSIMERVEALKKDLQKAWKAPAHKDVELNSYWQLMMQGFKRPTTRANMTALPP